jgi:membrane-associated phospholipid phosphatase
VIGLRERLAAERPAKTAVLLGLAVGICVPYYLLQRLQVFPLWAPPVTPLDAWIPFDPGSVYAYGSIALLVPLGPLLATRRDELVRYARGLALLCAVCFAAFLFVPVEGPRPAQPPGEGLYGLLVAWDTRQNSFPSLHAGLVVYSLLCLGRVLGGALRGGRRALGLALGLLWGALILYATLATRQHWALDLPPGMLLAWACHRWAWRETSPAGRPQGSPVES